VVVIKNFFNEKKLRKIKWGGGGSTKRKHVRTINEVLLNHILKDIPDVGGMWTNDDKMLN